MVVSTEESQMIQLPDGRKLGYACYGVPAGRPLLYFHGLPSSRLEGRLLHAAACRTGFQVIAVDRPGYGLSSVAQYDGLGRWGEDIACLSELLGLESFALLGLSGGGPYAIAVAAACADRVTATALVGAVGPVFCKPLRQQMPFAGRLGFTLAGVGEKWLRLVYGDVTARLMYFFPALTHALVAFDVDASDREVLHQTEVAEILQLSVRQALGGGADGAVQDFMLMAADWGVDFASIRSPVQVWHGEEDRVVPPSHAAELAERIATASLHRIPGRGHFSLPVLEADIILGLLAEQTDFNQQVAV